jgi:hypothetical protein
MEETALPGMENLQDLILRRAKEIGGNNGDLSTRQLEARSQGKVSRATFQRMMAGEYDAVTSQRTIDGLALALEVSLRVVESAAGAPPSYGPFQLDDDAARLTPTQRKAVKHVVEAMLNPGMADATVTRLPVAARTRKPSRRT